MSQIGTYIKDSIEGVLREHPIIGFAVPVGTTAVSLIVKITPFLQFAGLIIGIAVGILTGMIKWKEYRR